MLDLQKSTIDEIQKHPVSRNQNPGSVGIRNEQDRIRVFIESW